tara:strand:+ start:1930 stop:2349 length:420 start_codon:yes stop_codon:yes gene_type:complete
MAKQTGLGDVVIIDDSGGSARTISNDLVDYGINIAQELIETTGLDKSARERITGMSDGDVSLNGVFNPASNMSHDVFKVRTGTRTFVLKVGGATTGNPQISMELVIASYSISRGSDGALTWSVTMNLADGTVPTYSTVS